MHKSIPRRRLLAIVLLLSLRMDHAQQTTNVPFKIVRIDAEVRQLTGEPMSGLRAQNFIVTAASGPLHVALEPKSTDRPTFLLIVVAAPSGYTNLPAIQSLLSYALPQTKSKDYSSALLGPNGEYVKFQPNNEALVNSLVPGKVVYKGYMQAIQDLAECRGRRAILYLTKRPLNPPAELIAAAENAGALIYEVGGDSRQNYIYEGFSRRSDVVRRVRTLYVEPSIQSAFRDIKSERSAFYEIAVDVPVSIQMIHLEVKTRAEYQMSASVYPETNAPVPTLTLPK